MAQRGQWVRAAFDLHDKEALRGDKRLGLLGIMDAQGPTPRNKQLFRQIFNNTNSMDSSDIRTLWKLGDILNRWQSPDLIKGLIKGMRKLNHAYRSELVLRRVTTEIPLSYRAPALPKNKRGDARHTWLRDEGAVIMWQVTWRRWSDWFKEQEFQEIDPGEGGRYEGTSILMPAGEKILDTGDAKWRKDLELRTFRLGQLDVGFVVDSTASMGRVIRWIQKDVIKMMRGFELISHEPRIGVILYRDKGDAYIVKGIHLTGSARKLARRRKRLRTDWCFEKCWSLSWVWIIGIAWSRS